MYAPVLLVRCPLSTIYCIDANEQRARGSRLAGNLNNQWNPFSTGFLLNEALNGLMLILYQSPRRANKQSETKRYGTARPGNGTRLQLHGGMQICPSVKTEGEKLTARKQDFALIV